MKSILFAVLLCNVFMVPQAFAEYFWEQTSGPEGGNVMALSSDGSGRLYAGTRGVFRSDDNGESWVELMHDSVIRSFAFGPGNEVYAGSEFGEIFFSNDRGGTWENIEPAINTRVISLLVTGADTLLAGTDGEGLFRTTDNGSSWTLISSGLQGMSIEAIVRNETTPCRFAAIDSGGYRPSASGVSWAEVV